MSGDEGARAPRVAVIVPVFNRLSLLRETVASLRAQTLTDAEFMMVDDSSTDGAREFLLALPNLDPRFKVIAKPEALARGPQSSRNLGLDATTALAVVMLDSDDLLAPECLERRYAVMEANPDVDVVVGLQAVFNAQSDTLKWVNIPNATVNDIDRFLELTHPLDVPWVNGGVMIRTAGLRSAGIRFRAEFTWDDIVFHLECLIAGLKVRWMPYDGAPDAFYRLHGGETRGQLLGTEWGIGNAASMFSWVGAKLSESGLLTPGRRSVLARGLYRSCILPSIDSGNFRLARQVIDDAVGGSIVERDEARSLAAYVIGRSLLRPSDRLTFYWNRFSDRSLLSRFLSAKPSTYNSVPVENRGARMATLKLQPDNFTSYLDTSST